MSSTMLGGEFAKRKVVDWLGENVDPESALSFDRADSVSEANPTNGEKPPGFGELSKKKGKKKKYKRQNHKKRIVRKVA